MEAKERIEYLVKYLMFQHSADNQNTVHFLKEIKELFGKYTKELEKELERYKEEYSKAVCDYETEGMKAGRLEDKVKELELKLTPDILNYNNMVQLLEKISKENEELKKEKKEITEKAFIQGQNFTYSKYDSFEDWGKQDVQKCFQ